jgi:hypothetical protein
MGNGSNLKIFWDLLLRFGIPFFGILFFHLPGNAFTGRILLELARGGPLSVGLEGLCKFPA